MTSVIYNQQQETMDTAPSFISVGHHKQSAFKKSYNEWFNPSSLVSTLDEPYAAAASWKRRRLIERKLQMEVFEQPRSSGLIFVGPNQRPTPDSYITGEKNTKGRSSSPSLLLTYRGPVKIVWYLVADSGMHPHPYSLEGEDCQGGVCVKKVEVDGQVISFPGLYIRRVHRREVKKSLEKRVDMLKMHLPGKEFKIKDSMEYNLGSVRICFQVMLIGCDEGSSEMSMLALTRSLHSNEPALQREPRILSLSQCKGSVRGHEELSLQVTNLQTDDVMVYFHCESLVPVASWQAFAEVISVSRENSGLANVVIQTPVYHDQRISTPQTVSVQIRLMNNSISNTVKYTYIPLARGVSRIEQRVKMKEPIYIQHFTCLGGVAPLPSALGMSIPNGHDGVGKGPSKLTDPVKTVFARNWAQRPKPVRATKPKKVNASSQTDERHLVSEDELMGYDSEEELGSGVNAVDYDRLFRYRSLMADTAAPPEAGNREEEKTDQAARLRMDFSPRGILGYSLHASSSDTSSLAPVREMRESNSCCSEKSSGDLRVLLRSLSLEGEKVSSSPADPCESTSKIGGCHTNPAKSDELVSSKTSPRTSLEGDHVDTALVGGDDTSLKVEPVDALSTRQYLAADSSLPEFSADEVVPEPQGASSLPDLSESKLFPARLKPLDKIVAIKKIDRICYQDEPYSCWYSLKHRNLISLIGVMKDKKSISLVLEFPVGCVPSEMSPLSIEVQVNWLLQVAEGLSCLHQNGLTHREVTPANFLISETGAVMLSIPSNLSLAGSHVEGKMSLPYDMFEKFKKSDVYSFGIVVWEFVNRQKKTLTHSRGAFHKSPEDQMLFGLVSLADDCQNHDESQRPDMIEIVRKLRNLDQHRPQASGAPGIPSLIVESADPDTTPLTSPADQSEEAFNTPDSGVHCFPRFKESSQLPDALGAKHEPEDSLGSRFSDCSQKSKSSRDEEMEFSDADSSSNFSLGIQAANQQSSEGVKVTNTDSKAQDAQDPNANRKDDSKEDDSMGATGNGHEHSGGQDGDQGQREDPDWNFGRHLSPPRVTKRIDHRGGSLKLLNGNISLEIPPGALNDGQAEDILLTLDWNDQHIPPLKETEMNAAPIVHCGPTGLKFNIPVLLRIPHCAVISDPKKCNVAAHYSNTHEGEQPRWERISKEDISEVVVECDRRCVLLRVTHFCSFTLTFDGEETQAKEIKVVAYGKEVDSFADDQEISIYLYDSHCGNRELIKQEEEQLKGMQMDGPSTYLFVKLHEAPLKVEVEYHDQAWLLKSRSPRATFSFFTIWNVRSYNRCKYTFSNPTRAREFRCHIVAQQERNENQVTLEMSNHVKIAPELSSSEADPGPQQDSCSAVEEPPSYRAWFQYKEFRCTTQKVSTTAHPESEKSLNEEQFLQIYNPPGFDDVSSSIQMESKISYSLLCSLCEQLDPPDEALKNDWRRLADHFGYDMHRIRIWESKSSPTQLVLQAAEQEQKFKSLEDLCDALEKINRMDAAKKVKEEMKKSMGNPHRAKPLALPPPGNVPMEIGDSPTTPENAPLPLTGNLGPDVDNMALDFPRSEGSSHMNPFYNPDSSSHCPEQGDIRADILNRNRHTSEGLAESFQSLGVSADNHSRQRNLTSQPTDVTPFRNKHPLNDLAPHVSRKLFNDDG